jgi:hypothetical protein
MMHKVINHNSPKLDTNLCYECGFYTNTILREQKKLFQEYQKLFIRCKEKGIDLSLKNFTPTEFQQRNKTPDDETEPNLLIFLYVYNPFSVI